MKRFNFMISLLLIMSLSSCVESIERKISHSSIQPDYHLEKEDLENKISNIIKAKQVKISTSKITETGKSEINTLHIEITPEISAMEELTFAEVAAEVQQVVEEGVNNFREYNKLEIVLSQSVKEEGTEHDRTYKKVVEL